MDRPVDLALTPDLREQTRARYPDETGDVVRDGVRLHWEVYGTGEATVLLLPTWSIVHSRHWKMQIPYLARHSRVVTFDGRGNGASDRPLEGYDALTFAGDALAVLDATHTQRAFLISLSLGAQWSLVLAAEHPARVEGSVFICPSVPIGASVPARKLYPWDIELDIEEGWAKYNSHYWLRDYRGFLEFFFAQMYHEPHSTKAIEDCVGWGLETTPEVLIATQAEGLDEPTTRALAARLGTRSLVIQGTDDAITGAGRGIALAEAARSELVLLDGSGHGPHVRDPVKVNHLLRDFIAPAPAPTRWARGRSRRKRALYISSPIGLGHARRDVAIADELRKLIPISRSTGSRKTRSRACSPRAASASIPRARISRTSRRTSRASRRSTTCTRSRRSAAWMRSCSRTSWSSTTSCATSSTTSGSATRPGSSTTTYTRTRS